MKKILDKRLKIKNTMKYIMKYKLQNVKQKVNRIKDYNTIISTNFNFQYLCKQIVGSYNVGLKIGSNH